MSLVASHYVIRVILEGEYTFERLNLMRFFTIPTNKEGESLNRGN